jgi:hypothetical protein
MDNINYDYEIEKKAHPENFDTINVGDEDHDDFQKIPLDEEYGECEKCGGETSDRLIGDETYNKCGDCGWITH